MGFQLDGSKTLEESIPENDNGHQESHNNVHDSFSGLGGEDGKSANDAFLIDGSADQNLVDPREIKRSSDELQSEDKKCDTITIDRDDEVAVDGDRSSNMEEVTESGHQRISSSDTSSDDSDANVSVNIRYTRFTL